MGLYSFVYSVNISMLSAQSIILSSAYYERPPTREELIVALN